MKEKIKWENQNEKSFLNFLLDNSKKALVERIDASGQQTLKAIAIIQSYKHLAYYQTKKKTKGKKKNHDMKSKFSSFFYQ